MVEGKQLTIRIPDELYIKMQERRKEFGFKTDSELVRSSVEFYLEHADKNSGVDLPDEMKRFYLSEEGAMWFGMLLDRELARRSERNLGLK
jgi:metal-responsive CopG/Arc/MetJ family transcriptional regulator